MDGENKSLVAKGAREGGGNLAQIGTFTKKMNVKNRNSKLL